jgi:hypothetical protein
MDKHAQRQTLNPAGNVAGTATTEDHAPKANPPTLDEPSIVSPQPPKGSLGLVNRYIAYCGNDCTQCPLYADSCPKGCLGNICANYCNTCAIRNCNLERQIANCAHCDDYPCQKLETQFGMMVNDGYGLWATIARAVLEEVRRSNA